MSVQPDGTGAERDPPFARTATAVLIVEVVTLAALWLLQASFGR